MLTGKNPLLLLTPLQMMGRLKTGQDNVRNVEVYLFFKKAVTYVPAVVIPSVDRDNDCWGKEWITTLKLSDK